MDDETHNTQIETLSTVRSLFGHAFEIASHDATVRNLEVHFEEDRRRAAERFRAKQKEEEARIRRRTSAKRKLPKLQRKIRSYLQGKPEGVPSPALIAKFEPMLKKHGFTPAQFRGCLRKAATQKGGVWTVQNP